MEEEILLHFHGNNFKYFILLSLIIILSLNKTSQNYDFFILTRNYRALFVRRKDYLKCTNNPSFSENNLTGFI